MTKTEAAASQPQILVSSSADPLHRIELGRRDLFQLFPNLLLHASAVRLETVEYFDSVAVHIDRGARRGALGLTGLLGGIRFGIFIIHIMSGITTYNE